MRSTNASSVSWGKELKKYMTCKRSAGDGGALKLPSGKITSIERLTDDIKLVTIKITKGNVSFSAGQFIGVYDARHVVNSESSIFPGTFSIASAPCKLPYVSFAIGEDQNPRNLRHHLYFKSNVGDTVKLDKAGSGTVVAMVNNLLELGVWPGSIRTDYTTRVDPARRLHEMEKASYASSTNSCTDVDSLSEWQTDSEEHTGTGQKLRFAACADATQAKGNMVSEGNNYLKTYGLNVLFSQLKNKISEEKPDYPLQFIAREIERVQKKLPEISNSNAGDPRFWINYYETDMVTWQAPVTSPWLERYIGPFLGNERKRVFVPLCGKSLDLKLLLDKGHHVIGAECSGIACSDFFVENNIPDYVKEEVHHEQGKHIIRHKSKSLLIEIYEGDVFDLTIDVLGCPVDAVLDRAALVALPPSLIKDKYLPLITSLMTFEGKMLFASVSELPFPKAPPHIYKDEMIEALLGDFFSCVELKEVYRYRVNAGYVSEPIYLLDRKLSYV